MIPLGAATACAVAVFDGGLTLPAASRAETVYRHDGGRCRRRRRALALDPERVAVA